MSAGKGVPTYLLHVSVICYLNASTAPADCANGRPTGARIGMSFDLALLSRGPPIQIAVPEPSLVPHVRGRGTVDEPHSRPSTRQAGSYSSHSCVGDETTIKPRANRACLFENVCLDTSVAKFLYYRDPAATRAPVLFDRRYGHLFAFGHEAPKGGREEYLPLNKHVRYKRHVRWSPRMVDGPMPAGAPTLRPLHVLSAPFVPTNLGHLAWEEAFPMLLAMTQLGVYASETETVVLRTHGCNESVAGRNDDGEMEAADPPSRSEAKLCSKFVDGFVRPIGATLTIQALAAQHAATGQRHVCFKRLVGGGFYDIFNTAAHPGKEPWLQLYRHRVLAHHRLAPPMAWAPPPVSHKLLLVRKEGRRGIANFEKVLEYVRGACEGLCEGIPVVAEASFQTMTIREQLELVSTSTIALTPPGGVSMIVPFLPDGAHAILVNYMLGNPPTTKRLRGAEGTCRACSLTMEESLWNAMRHVHKLLYQVWEPSDFARGRVGRDSAVIIQPPRLAYLLRIALEAMAPR